MTMLDLTCLLFNLFLIAVMLYMVINLALMWQIRRNMPHRLAQKQQIPIIGENESAPLPEPEPIPATPLDLDTAFEELWTVLHDTGVTVTQDWFIQAWFGNDDYHTYKCSDGSVLVWYGKMPEPAKAYQQADVQKRKAAKQQQKGNSAA